MFRIHPGLQGLMQVRCSSVQAAPIVMIPQVEKKAVSGAAMQWCLLFNAPRQMQNGVGQAGTGLLQPVQLAN